LWFSIFNGQYDAPGICDASCTKRTFASGALGFGGTMQYIQVRWIHDFRDEPILIYCEIDDVGWELRKVEIYRNGDVSFASKAISAGASVLSTEPLPSLSEIASDTQFETEIISKEEFDNIWVTYTEKK
jgi:hypothetical protein